MMIVMENRICCLIAAAACSIFYATSAEASADTYLGCYNEHGTEEVFAIIPTSNTFHSLTPGGCRETCRKDLIYSFAGLWAGTHCYCASGLNEQHIQPVNNSLCYLYCPTEPAEFCGGSNVSSTLSVYSVCSKGTYGRNCTSKCNCKDNRSCTVRGICPGNECAAGWKLNTTIPNRQSCSIDIDECATNTTICDDKKCINVDGGYYCDCQSGYELHYDPHRCVDADECQTHCSSLDATNYCHLCKQHYECENTIGSYTCRCKNGFSIDTQQDTCEDIDECDRKMANCSHTCTNTNGSYECGCFEGFRLEDDKQRCVVVERGLWRLLVLGLGLGIGVLIIVVLALTIAVCKLLARRRIKTTTTANYTGNRSQDNFYESIRDS